MFKLEIELGNDAMRTPGDVAKVLLEMASLLAGEGTPSPFRVGRVLDTNGNVVGEWRFDPRG